LFIRIYNLGKHGQATTKSLIVMKCDECDVEFKRAKASHDKVSSNLLYDQDYCQKCWRGVLNNRPAHRASVSRGVQNRYDTDPDLSKRKKKSSAGINRGEKNGMKKLASREKVSRSRQTFFENEKNRQAVSKTVKKAWADGKYDGVAVGRCKWFELRYHDGTSFKVQGTWEKRYAEWMLSENINFQAHKGRIPYEINGVERNYYPDFYLPDTDKYIEIKNRYHFSLQHEKFDAIRKQHPDLRLQLIFGSELRERGIL